MIQRLRRGQVRSYDNRVMIDELVGVHVPATFFLFGLWMLQYPAETRRIADNPLFEVGTHSFSQRGFRPRCYDLGTLPVTQMSADVVQAERVLARFTDHPSPYFRFPGGCNDRTALAAIAPTGVTVIQYDVASGDAFGTNTAQIVAHTLADTRWDRSWCCTSPAATPPRSPPGPPADRARPARPWTAPCHHLPTAPGHLIHFLHARVGLQPVVAGPGHIRARSLLSCGSVTAGPEVTGSCGAIAGFPLDVDLVHQRLHGPSTGSYP